MAIQSYPENSLRHLKGGKTAEQSLGVSVKELQRSLKLSGLLQTTLDIENVLQYFLDSARLDVEFSSCHFSYTPFELVLNFGERSRHSCVYQLNLGDSHLGELTFSHTQRFPQQELAKLEQLLTHLIYPLRNAILYQQALIASQMDPLTGAHNRTAMEAALNREVELAHRHHNPLSMLMLDLDHFKQINDQHGHACGDYVLQSIVNCMQDNMRGSDMLFRYGGEEFVLVLSGTDQDGALNMAERLRSGIENYPFRFNGAQLQVTASMGVATLGARDDVKRLFNKADASLYQAKHNGRNRVHCYAAPRLKKVEAD